MVRRRSFLESLRGSFRRRRRVVALAREMTGLERALDEFDVTSMMREDEGHWVIDLDDVMAALRALTKAEFEKTSAAEVYEPILNHVVTQLRDASAGLRKTIEASAAKGTNQRPSYTPNNVVDAVSREIDKILKTSKLVAPSLCHHLAFAGSELLAFFVADAECAALGLNSLSHFVSLQHGVLDDDDDNNEEASRQSRRRPSDPSSGTTGTTTTTLGITSYEVFGKKTRSDRHTGSMFKYVMTSVVNLGRSPKAIITPMTPKMLRRDVNDVAMCRGAGDWDVADHLRAIFSYEGITAPKSPSRSEDDLFDRTLDADLLQRFDVRCDPECEARAEAWRARMVEQFAAILESTGGLVRGESPFLVDLAVEVRCYVLRRRARLRRFLARRTRDAQHSQAGLAPCLTGLGNALVKSQRLHAALLTHTASLYLKEAEAVPTQRRRSSSLLSSPRKNQSNSSESAAEVFFSETMSPTRRRSRSFFDITKSSSSSIPPGSPSSSLSSLSSDESSPRNEEEAQLVPTLFNIGAVQRMLGQHRDAAVSYKEALEIVVRVGDNVGAAAALHEQAVLAEQACDPATFGDAIPAYTVALEARRRAHGDKHHAVADTLFCRGRARLNANDERGALADLVQDLDIRKASLGPRHPAVATCLTHLGFINFSLRAFDVAVDMFDDALSIRKAVFGVGHPAVGLGATAVADAYVKLRDYKHAADRYKTAHTAYRLGGATTTTRHLAFAKFVFYSVLGSFLQKSSSSSSSSSEEEESVE